jgi:hypothetical protein
MTPIDYVEYVVHHRTSRGVKDHYLQLEKASSGWRMWALAWLHRRQDLVSSPCRYDMCPTSRAITFESGRASLRTVSDP